MQLKFERMRAIANEKRLA